MGTVKHADILTKIYQRLIGTAAITALVPVAQIVNHVPQDQDFPTIRFRWDEAEEWDTKDSQGFAGEATFEVWVEQHGDLLAWQIVDAINEAFHTQPLTLAAGQNVLLRYARTNSFVEVDGVTHHLISRFDLIATD